MPRSRAAQLRALPIAALVELLCRAAAAALRLGAAGALAAAAHASSTAAALLVSALARAYHRRQLAAYAPSPGDDEACVIETAGALRELCSVNANGGVACACACLRSMAGSEATSVASKAIAFCSAAMRLPRDLQTSMRVLEVRCWVWIFQVCRSISNH